MDAARNVTEGEFAKAHAKTEVQGAEIPRSAQVIREEISVTSQALHDRIDELRQRLNQRFGSLQNPFHIRERVESRPFVACGIALLAGFVLGTRRGYRVPIAALRGVGRASGGLVRGMGHTFGAQLSSTILSRILSGGR
jgi:hypothetical protein